MKQEYEDRLNVYRKSDYQQFLKSKNVLDAWQYLHSSLLYLDYAIVTAKLYEDAGKNNILESRQNPFHDSVEIMNQQYKAHNLLNKLAVEWVTHISNSIDCLLQYINAALNLGVVVHEVKQRTVLGEVTDPDLRAKYYALRNDKTISHILSINNYNKHTLSLFGNSSLADIKKGQRDIKIPCFRYRSQVYPEICVSELMENYDEFMGKYLDVLDATNIVISNNAPVSNRYHIDNVIVSGEPMGNGSGLVLIMDLKEDGIHTKDYRFENVPFALNGTIEIMLNHRKNIGQHIRYIDIIQVYENGVHVANLEIVNPPENSALAYYEYKVTPVNQ